MSMHTDNGSAASQQTATPIQPGIEWLRPSTVPRTHGISRASLYRYMGDGLIQSVLLRRKGNKSGIRLVNKASLDAFIGSFGAAN